MTNEAVLFPRVYSPWRRFFARTLDLNLYALLFSLLLLPLGIHGPVASLDLELYGVHVTCDSSLDTQADQGELRLVMEKQGADPWD